MNKVFILGAKGQIGLTLTEILLSLSYEITLNEDEANIIALCVSSDLAKPYLENSNKILLNFTSTKIEKDNIINGIGCSTLSVLKPLFIIKELYPFIEDINVTTLFPQNALSKKSNLKNKNENIPVYTYNHNHQKEIESILKLRINMSHFITPVNKNITSSITIRFKKPIFLNDFMLKYYPCFTRDNITWNIISILDNLYEPVEYMIKKLKEKLEC